MNLLNFLLGISALAAVAAQIRRGSFLRTMRFFTAQSNVFCAIAALAVGICRLAGDAPWALLVVKYMATAAVAVTMLTVLFFLLPQYGPKAMFGGADLWLHLLCPVMALITYFGLDRPAMSFAQMLLGMLPVLLYGVLYLYKTVLGPAEVRWEDFYGFNKTGKWPVSFAAMAAGTFLICLALWAL